MVPKYEIGDSKNYLIPFADLDQLTLPSTAKQKYYYKSGKRLAIALAQLGYVGKITNDHVQLIP